MMNHARMQRMRDAAYYAKVQALRFLQKALFFLPVKKDRILFYISNRRGFCCNLKYLALEVKKQSGAECIWVTEHPESCREAEEAGFKVVRARSLRHMLLQLTSGAVAVNDGFHEWVPLRRRQVTLNTWHAAMNYKRIGPRFVQYRNSWHRRIHALRNVQPMLYASGSRYFTQDTAYSFGFDEKVFYPTGSPRNDVLFGERTALRQKVCSRYHLDEGTKLALYAPTFRKGEREDCFGLDFAALRQSLQARFGGEWRILYRRHYFVRGNAETMPGVTDVSDYDDMNELLAAADVLISDYSSCLWDYTITGRPAFVYAPDLKAYHEADRDFSYPVEKWPYPLAQTPAELDACIRRFDEACYRERVKSHQLAGGMYDDGLAAQRTAKLLLDRLNKH